MLGKGETIVGKDNWCRIISPIDYYVAERNWTVDVPPQHTEDSSPYTAQGN